jgi:hypothetical protein
MDSILSSLKDLLNNVKNLTLPGLVAALGFVFLLWPPQPIDVVNDVTVNDAYRDDKWPTTTDGLRGYAGRIDPVCRTVGTLRKLPNPENIQDIKQLGVENQFNLERIARTLRECSEKEKALSGFEDSQISAANAEIEVLKKERDAIQDTYLNYEKAANPLRMHFRDLLDKKEKDIQDEQACIRELEQLKRERDRRATELDRLSKDVSDRLADPGRLRPKATFDDFLAILSNHIIAFLALAFGWSILFEPINRALFGYIYDGGFDDRLDILYYESRHPPVPRPPEYRSWNLAIFFGVVILLIGFLFAAFWAASLHQAKSHNAEQPPSMGTSTHDSTACDPLTTPCNLPIKQPPKLWRMLAISVVSTLVGLLFPVFLSRLLAQHLYKRMLHDAKQEEDQQKDELIMGPKERQRFEFLKSRIIQEILQVPEEAQNKPAKELNPEVLQAIQQAVKHLTDEEGSPKFLKAIEQLTACEIKLVKLWDKISQPEYAIGQGLLTRDDYNAIQDQYYGQTQISFGLILPLAFLTFAILATPQLGLTGLWVVCAALALAVVQALLLSVGTDRRNKFETEVESHIASQFLKTCEANQKPASPAPKPDLADQIRKVLREELPKLEIADTKLKIVYPPPETSS